MTRIKHIFISIILLLPIQCWCQTDTAFWYTTTYDGYDHYTFTIYIITHDQPAEVTFSMPAEPLFTPFSVTIPADSFYYAGQPNSPLINFSNNHGLATIPAIINNRGLLITSTAPVTCYTHNGSDDDDDILILKGTKGLGTDFIVPMQSVYPGFLSRSGIQIVATHDSTQVQITPPPGRQFSGWYPYSPINRTLQRGQSYAVEAANTTAFDHLGGTIVHASYPVAVFTTDYQAHIIDSNTGIGTLPVVDDITDQMLPNDQFGTQYFAIRSFHYRDDSTENVYIYPADTADTVHVFFNGTLETTLCGRNYSPIPLHDTATLITTDKPAAVFQTTGAPYGVAGALLHPIFCTGTHRAALYGTHSSSLFHNQFRLNILVKKIFVSDFRLNGDTSVITARDFHTLAADTTLAWCSKDILPLPSNIDHHYIILENPSGIFHLGLVWQKPDDDGTSFGYFCDYGKPSYVRIDMDSAYCTGDSVVFTYNAPFIDNLTLTGPGGLLLTQPPFVLHNINRTMSGRYYLEGIDTSSCHQLRTDSIDIVMLDGTIRFDMDTLYCLGDTIRFTYTATPGLENPRLSGPGGLLLDTPPFTLTATDTALSGFYRIEAIDTGLCHSTVFDSLYIHIFDHRHSEVNDTIAENQLPWLRFDTLFYQETDTTLIIPSLATPCDSIVHYRLHICYTSHDTILYYACPGDLPVHYDSAIFYQEGQGTFNFTGSHGEDSLVTFILHVIPSSDTTIYDTITEDQLPWFSFDTLFNDTVSDYIYHLFNEAGCDSLIHYNLYIFWNGDHCDTALSYPNVVTPNGDGVNDRFVIGGLIEHNCFKYNELTIYDRTGHQVYHKRNINNESDWWDPAAQRAPSGTYFYYFKAHGVNIWTQHRGVIEVLWDK